MAGMMIVGMHRRLGTKGGQLAAVGETGFFAELEYGAARKYGTIWVWKPVDRNRVASWEFIEADQVSWLPSSRSGSKEHRVRVTVNGKTHEVVFRDALHEHLHQQLELRTLADWVIRPRLLKVSGIAQVLVMGSGRKQYQVLVNPTALQEYGVTLQEVEDALKKNNANTTGGFAIQGETERPIRVPGRLRPEPDQ